MTTIKEVPGNSHISFTIRNRNLFLSLIASVLIVAAVIAIFSGHKINSDTRSHSSSHSIIKSTCSSTLYPDLCFSTIANSPELSIKFTTKKDVILAAINRTITAVEHNFFLLQKLKKKKALTKRAKIAIHNCLELIDNTIDELHKAEDELKEYPNQKTLSEQADDLKTLLSSAITNRQTCLDGFSHDKLDKKVRKSFLLQPEVHVGKLCSNALAMIKNLTDTDMAVEAMTTRGRNLQQNQNREGGWPKWLSAGDRKLLQSRRVTPNVVVAADGSGNFRTVAAAVAAAPSRSTVRYVIRIKAGVYRENVEVPSSKPNIMFLGDGQMKTTITASRSVGGGSTTFQSATVAAVGERFLARDITFQNTAGPQNNQAVALRVGSDLSAFYKCGFIAYQDTLYVHTNRQFYINCFVSGTVDFIFGNAAVVLQDCDIKARRPGPSQKNMVTAQGRTDPNQNTGIVIQKCRIGATSDLQPVMSTFPTYLGRPWKEYSRTVVMQSHITNVINPAGWFEWDGNFALNTLEYREYKNTGAGADTSHRVNWRGYKVITSATEAQQYTAGRFIAGGSWLNSTGFRYSLGL